MNVSIAAFFSVIRSTSCIVWFCENASPQGLLEDFQGLLQLTLFLHDRRLYQEKHRALANPEAEAERLLEATGGRPIPPLP